MSTALGKTVLERSYSTPVYVLAATSVNNVYMINVYSPCRCEQHGKRICQHPKRNILKWFMEFRYNSYMAKCTKSNYSQRGIYSLVQRLHSCQHILSICRVLCQFGVEAAQQVKAIGGALQLDAWE